MVYQRPERRRVTGGTHPGKSGRSFHGHNVDGLPPVRKALQPKRLGGFWRAVATLPRTLAVPSGTTEPLSEPFPADPGGRISGHQYHPVRLAADPGREPGAANGGGRRRPVHLRLARRENRKHPAVPAGLSQRPDGAIGTELPLHATDPESRQRGDCQQPGPVGQGTLDRRPGWRAHQFVCGLQRAGRSQLHRRHHW